MTFIDEAYSNFTINPDLGIISGDEATKGQVDVHEHQMTDRNTMLVSSYDLVPKDLERWSGPRDGWLYDSMFFEIDVKTSEVLFKWRALDHVPIRASKRMLSGRKTGTEKAPWEWFHINSIQAIGEDYLISSYYYHTIYFISGKNGKVLWQLNGQEGGGTLSDGELSVPLPASFKGQHHARAHNISNDGMTISMFNNNGGRKSNALAFYLPLPPSPYNPPQLVRRLETRSHPVGSATMGSYQMNLVNGNGFVGYGRTPIAREYGQIVDGGPNSELLWEGQYGYIGAAQCYRTMKAEWYGTPKAWDPVAVFEEVRLNVLPPRVYVSWNGATNISDWMIYAGDKEDKLKLMGVAEKKGFETTFELRKKDLKRCVQLGAVRNGDVIRRSNVACIEYSRGKDSWWSDTKTVAIFLTSTCITILAVVGARWRVHRRRRASLAVKPRHFDSSGHNEYHTWTRNLLFGLFSFGGGKEAALEEEGAELIAEFDKAKHDGHGSVIEHNEILDDGQSFADGEEDDEVEEGTRLPILSILHTNER